MQKHLKQLDLKGKSSVQIQNLIHDTQQEIFQYLQEGPVLNQVWRWRLVLKDLNHKNIKEGEEELIDHPK